MDYATRFPGAIILPYNGVWPSIDDSAFIAPGAVVAGDVTIGAESNIWFGCVIRGDVQKITIGARTNIQDGSVIHVTRETGPTTIGSGVTIGHLALLHACTVEDDSFFGMRAVAMDFAVIESGGMLAAGAMLTPKKRVPKGEVWAGNPAKHFRSMTPDEIAYIPFSAAHYVRLGQAYKG
jgi:carbonic anhydrase/acetyltransferase-like protein (isoleucine patch superfamily)